MIAMVLQQRCSTRLIRMRIVSDVDTLRPSRSFSSDETLQSRMI